MRKWCAALLGVWLAAGTAGGAAAQGEAGFQAYLSQVRGRALAAGVTARTLDAVLPTLSVNPRVIELDRGQPGGTAGPPSAVLNFAPYRARHVDAARISRGKRAYAANRTRLSRIEAETGVPESIMVAIWGHETNYGSYTGDFDLARSLATLAYEGRRRALFEGELIALLKMMDRGIPRERLKGSWAGAMGHPQFLPSIYLRLARDGDGDGQADIWRSEADALASIANYFVNAGWRAGQPWGVAVNVPASFNRGALTTRTISPRCPRVFERHSRWRTMREWRQLGMVPQAGRWPADDVLATLIEPDGPGRTAYLLTGNYRVILDYNCSNFYALSVGLLADAVAG
ncbi:lytic transglycosylase [Sphingomonas spermidinifaciens]|uniref:Lytic transglycosylase n=1 Tax=Sphingomonas spermidinifaciens TaxID=1141889 RepID=A0A2A4B4P3_9SPHN|nr:lytic murein transglycosylase [Sphingomonas spermidinifaciens]PCD03027.1 lytic transglycosylase [Sphingomonas spermidinifaciens]